MRFLSIRSLIAAVACLAACAALSVAPAGALPTATGYDRCPQGRFCLFDGWDGQGDMYLATGTRYDQVLAEAGFDDRASSVFNNASIVWCVWQGPNYTGRGAGYSAGLRENLDDAFNNQVSSVNYGRFTC
ncbi:MAG TPA: peptidase inhibitor family I36 protein [Yinghuangia sp.]|uniref:peptidase inhibitor family I36 protein n=1 Tax=Yinghuangia sp. YIM S10712 TaxID=3436930 RepID=UPI002CBD7C31|nr:peptidase inhibitor family I36 protein [Yinghuangia sp.]